MSVTDIIDTNRNCSSAATRLRSLGVKTVIRYYSRDSDPGAAKRLGKAEALSLVQAGLRLCVVHQGKAKHGAEYFGSDSGRDDGAYAKEYAEEVIQQPHGSAIYFAVDFDCSKTQLANNVVPYFEAVLRGLSADPGQKYEVGVYGNGLVCAGILEANLANFAWLAQSTGWRDYENFLKSGRWTLSQLGATHVGGISCDPNLLNSTSSFGEFTLQETAMPVIQNSAIKYVNARSGVRLRAGPGTEFEKLALLPHGSKVWCVSFSASWTLVDLQGDGAADGYVSSGYLSDAPSASVIGTAFSFARDIERIPTLVGLGQDAAALAAVAKTAKAAHSPYPSNGCALHLSALLRLSGIDVPLTYGAGALASLLQRKRGWTIVEVGHQMPGDVGVTFDNDPTPPGADHVYLVVERIDSDEMSIADNQNDGANAPHTRFASGRGKTPTEYFLRAA